MTSANHSLSLPKGFIPVMLTPFLDSGEVDFEGLKLLTELYIEAGCAGLFANCLSSEMYELNEEERLQVTQMVVNQAAGRVPVVATGTFGGPVPLQADFVKRIYEIGVQAVIIITSLLADENESDDIFLSRAKELIDLTNDVPLGFYECPVPYKRLIKSGLLKELVQTGRIIYHKDTSLDIYEVTDRIKAAEGFHFGLYDAYMVNAVQSLLAGAAGLSCIQGNIYPELIVWICKHYNDPERQNDVSRLQEFFTDSMDLVHTAYPVIAKYSLRKRGFPISTFTRRKVDPLTDELKKKMDELLQEVEILRQELDIPDIFEKYAVK
ncbi:dihydrodipicolinate synthase family protein [Dyadobacter flavalbus]|uniref:Dihydrodipicolinate synthase family protein n=1 Tax=Dyadobacter flavalbus TaxID=2579942 RepID=A0A5M8QZR0_9BACT|nr:dihydrodipicolinate synthase family protein [Dyadobacter flavalbus]KAA6440166.1 dihydrodipicolinate synthase family protein [Dyadobacter flavalbus]